MNYSCLLYTAGYRSRQPPADHSTLKGIHAAIVNQETGSQKTQSHITVSYTHLDVYKRQGDAHPIQIIVQLSYYSIARIRIHQACRSNHHRSGSTKHKFCRIQAGGYASQPYNGYGNRLAYLIYHPKGNRFDCWTGQSPHDARQNRPAGIGIPVSYTHLDVYKRQV